MILCHDVHWRRDPQPPYLYSGRPAAVVQEKPYILPRIKMTKFGALCWLSWVLSATAAQFGSFSPSNGLTFSIHVPNSTATSKSGPIYFQINTASPLTWVALGQGTQMAGANMFVVYSDAAGDNVTVSPRLGKGHVQPLFNPNAKISVMEGSGIQNGTMTANVRCDSCLHWDGGSLNPMNSASPWIWAAKAGSPLKSDSPSATISQHDEEGNQVVDLTKVTGDDSANPFAGLSSSSAGASSSESESWGGSSGGEGPYDKKVTAHAVLMIIAFVILFPFSALSLHLFPSFGIMTAHAPLQLFTLALAIVGMGLGISMADDTDQMSEYHPIIGVVVVAWLILFQPAMGFLQHRYFRKTGSKSIFAYFHRWFGRALIVLGVVNAGLGFQLSGIGDGNPTGAVIAYAVVAGVFAVAYILVVTLIGRRRQAAD